MLRCRVCVETTVGIHQRVEWCRLAKVLSSRPEVPPPLPPGSPCQAGRPFILPSAGLQFSGRQGVQCGRARLLVHHQRHGPGGLDPQGGLELTRKGAAVAGQCGGVVSLRLPIDVSTAHLSSQPGVTIHRVPCFPGPTTVQWCLQARGQRVNLPARSECMCHLSLPPNHTVGLQARGAASEPGCSWQPCAAAHLL